MNDAEAPDAHQGCVEQLVVAHEPSSQLVDQRLGRHWVRGALEPDMLVRCGHDVEGDHTIVNRTDVEGRPVGPGGDGACDCLAIARPRCPKRLAPSKQCCVQLRDRYPTLREGEIAPAPAIIGVQV